MKDFETFFQTRDNAMALHLNTEEITYPSMQLFKMSCITMLSFPASFPFPLESLKSACFWNFVVEGSAPVLCVFQFLELCN